MNTRKVYSIRGFAKIIINISTKDLDLGDTNSRTTTEVSQCWMEDCSIGILSTAAEKKVPSKKDGGMKWLGLISNPMLVVGSVLIQSQHLGSV